MRDDVSAGGPWRIRGVPLPDGDRAGEWWIADGRWCDRPVAGASDLPGAWVLPGGLVDAHVHLTMNFDRVMPHADGSPALVAANAAAQRRAGVLALRDAGQAWGGTAQVGRSGPRLQRAGSLIAPPERGYPGVCRAVAAGDLVRVALEEVAAGARWVKILGDFPGPDGDWFGAPPTYPLDVVTTLVREVHAAGARVMAHSTGRGAAELVEAGVDSIEHGMALSHDLVRAMADRGIAWVTTLATAHKHVGALARRQDAVGNYVRAHLDRVRELLPAAASLGVPVLCGTDEIAMGAVGREIEWLVQYGLTPAQAIGAGATTARAWLAFPSARAGEPADVVTFDADPRADLAVLARPAAIVFDGALFADQEHGTAAASG